MQVFEKGRTTDHIFTLFLQTMKFVKKVNIYINILYINDFSRAYDFTNRELLFKKLGVSSK